MASLNNWPATIYDFGGMMSEETKKQINDMAGMLVEAMFEKLQAKLKELSGPQVQYAPPRDPSELVDLKVAARHLDVSERFMWKLKSKGAVPFVRVGRHIKFSIEDLDLYKLKKKTKAS